MLTRKQNKFFNERVRQTMDDNWDDFVKGKITREALAEEIGNLLHAELEFNVSKDINEDSAATWLFDWACGRFSADDWPANFVADCISAFKRQEESAEMDRIAWMDEDLSYA